jgi:hypothetical protein
MASLSHGNAAVVSAEPYLSLVVTARNDDHGGNLLGRMQAFVNGWLKQARRYGISSELIIVEWNPPEGRPRLAQALRWPEDSGPCTVRIIEVSPELHSRYPHGSALPLYQMIGKNVGIRRARGKFVLATNIDILFSSELMEFFAKQSLDPGRMYRMDRHDVMSDVPVDGDPEEQLAYCRDHVIRIHRREGSFVLSQKPAALEAPATKLAPKATKPASPAITAADLAAGLGIRFGEGWNAPEHYGMQQPFRWASRSSELLAETPPANAGALVLEVEPGPGTGGAPLDLEIVGAAGLRTRLQISRRCLLRVRTRWSPGTALAFHVHGELVPTRREPRLLPFRVLDVKWERSRGGDRPSVSVQEMPFFRRMAVSRDAFRHLIAKLANEGPLVDLTLMVPSRVSRMAKWYTRSVTPGGSDPEGRERVDRLPQTVRSPVFLHTNGCGDFTLLARERWFDLRAYPEFDLFSMNLDSVFCFAAHHGGAREEILADPMRIYHIEHGTGSGWTPEGQARLFRRIQDLGLSFVDNDTVLDWASHMKELDAPMIFNREDWGLAAVDLPETVPVAPRS